MVCRMTAFSPKQLFIRKRFLAANAAQQTFEHDCRVTAMGPLWPFELAEPLTTLQR